MRDKSEQREIKREEERNTLLWMMFVLLLMIVMIAMMHMGVFITAISRDSVGQSRAS